MIYDLKFLFVFQPSTGKKGAGGPGVRGGRPVGGVRPGGRGGGPGRNGAFVGGRPAGARPSPYDRPRIGERYGPPGAPPPRNGGGNL